MIKIEGLFLGGSLGYIDGKVRGYDEVIKIGYTYGKFLCSILVDLYGITLALYVGTELISLDGPFDGSNDVKI